MNKTYQVLLIGVGNIGSRHLQGLKKVNFPLSIEVVDPSLDSLKIAQERYQQTISNQIHDIKFYTNIDSISNQIDLVIISTSSDIRREITQQILSKSKIKYIIFEKLLFNKFEDYQIINDLLIEKQVKSWVNCSMRITPFYSNLKLELKSKKINCMVTGSQFGFITNLIHFIDYMAYLTDSDNYKISTDFLDRKPIESKRKGFLDFRGTISVYFDNGSTGIFSCFPEGNLPVTVEIINPDIRVMADESSRKTWISKGPLWGWQESADLLQYQSDLTNIITEKILKEGNCNLPSFKQSSKIHLVYLEVLKEYLNKYSKINYTYYPFT